MERSSYLPFFVSLTLADHIVFEITKERVKLKQLDQQEQKTGVMTSSCTAVS